MDKLAIAGTLAAVVIFGAVWYFVNRAPVPAATNTLDYSQTQTAAQQTQPQATQTNQQPNHTQPMQAILHTNKGDITIEFFADAAPTTVGNFTKLAQSGYYSGTKFHRIIAGFMIQGGDPLTKDDTQEAKWGMGGPGYTFADENQNAHNGVGIVSMANAGPNTNGSQFFINTAENSFLDGKYNVFGKVVAGMDVVSSIEHTPTNSSDRPLVPMVVNSVELK